MTLGQRIPIKHLIKMGVSEKDRNKKVFLEHSWQPKPWGPRISVVGIGETSKEAQENLKTELKNNGYTEPKWWKFWRDDS